MSRTGDAPRLANMHCANSSRLKLLAGGKRRADVSRSVTSFDTAVTSSRTSAVGLAALLALVPLGCSSGAGDTSGTDNGSGASSSQGGNGQGAAGQGANGQGASSPGGAGSGGGGVVTGQTVCGVADACVWDEERDRTLWPFHQCSPWNHPIGEGAQFETIQPEVPHSANWDKFGDFAKNWTTVAGVNQDDSHPVFVAGTEPCREGTISSSNNGDGGTAEYKWCLPLDTAPGATCYSGSGPYCPGDHQLHIIDPTKKFNVEMYQAVMIDGNITAGVAIANSLSEMGVFTTENQYLFHGNRAYGGTGLGGMIRVGEMKKGIRHALAISIPEQAMSKNSPNGKGWIWPATSRDDDVNYGTSGNVYMGSLLAIPADADLSDVNPELMNLAIALRDYGAYVVDRGAGIDPNGWLGNVNFYAEPGDSELRALRESVWEAKEFGVLAAKLRVVVNSSQSSVGGGGKTKTCFAPALDD